LPALAKTAKLETCNPVASRQESANKTIPMRRLEDIKKELKGLAANRLEDALLRLKELLPAGSELCREVALQPGHL
jgi:hypothetical protein